MVQRRGSERAALIPTGPELKSYGVIRSLSRHGIHTIVASPRSKLPHFTSRYCDEQVLLPAPPRHVHAYKDALLEVASRPEVVTAYPVRECDAYVFAAFRDEFEEHLQLVTPDLSTLRQGHDRLTLAAHAAAAGVPYAETRSLSDVETWDSDVVVKSRYNILTGAYLEDYPDGALEEVKRVTSVPAGSAPDASALRRTMKHDPIVQEFIPQADKHLYCALWEDGEPLATYQHRQLRQNSWVGGGGVYRKSAYSQQVADNAYDLLSHLEWDGYACIEYVKDAETGEWKFLEINPRVWQSMPEAVRAGADFPYYYWLAATGEHDRIDDSYETGIPCHIAYGELSHLLSIRRDDSPFIERPSFAKTAAQILWSSIRHPRFDYLRLDDPRLALNGIKETLSSGVTRSRNYDAGPSTHGRSEDDHAPREPQSPNN